MTILNLAIGADRAYLLSDTLLSGGAVSTYCSKTVALQDLRTVVAFSGRHVMFRAWLSALLAGLPAGTGIGDLETEAPAFLRDRWAKYADSGGRTSIVCIGAQGDELLAFGCDSDFGFAPHRLAPGLYLSPAFDNDRDHQRPLQPSSNDIRLTQVSNEAIIAAMPWRELVAACIDAVPLQIQHARVPIGGRLLATTITPDAIHSTTLREL